MKDMEKHIMGEPKKDGIKYLFFTINIIKIILYIYMYFISLGRHCSIAYNIRKFITNDVETQFFDWARTDFKCVLFILNLKNIDTIFNNENIKININKQDNDIAITFKNFNKDNLCLLYHHDIPYKEYNESEMNEKITDFINKYKRRHDRLINLIKNNKKIYFIYNITNGFDYNLFNKILIDINKNINYTLVLLIEEKDTYKIELKENYVKINLTNYLDKNITTDWFQPQYDWKSIFKIIQTF
jgi:hypothetical protein